MPVTTFSRNAREILKGPRDIFGKNARENFSLARGNFRKTARETSKVPVAKIEKTCVTGKMGVTGKKKKHCPLLRADLEKSFFHFFKITIGW